MRSSSLVLVCLVLAAAGCGERAEPLGADVSAFPVEVEGAGSEPTRVETEPQRIAALTRGTAELVGALGGGRPPGRGPCGRHHRGRRRARAGDPAERPRRHDGARRARPGPDRRRDADEPDRPRGRRPAKRRGGLPRARPLLHGRRPGGARPRLPRRRAGGGAQARGTASGAARRGRGSGFHARADSGLRRHRAPRHPSRRLTPGRSRAPRRRRAGRAPTARGSRASPARWPRSGRPSFCASSSRRR